LYSTDILEHSKTLKSREVELQLERQTGFEIERTNQIILQKVPGQQVGIKLVTQQSEVRIFSGNNQFKSRQEWYGV